MWTFAIATLTTDYSAWRVCFNDMADLMPFPATFSSLVYLVIELVAIASAIHALWYVRTTQATIAWVVGLIAMPMLTLPLYWLFGRYRFFGYRESIREVGLRHIRSVAAIERELKTPPFSATTALQTPLEQLADVLDTPICDHNSSHLLIDGEEFFLEVERTIQSAQRYVYVEFYIVRDDDVGNRVAQALIDARKRGVTIRFVYDEIGSLRLSNEFLKRLTDAGVDVRSFDTRRGPANRFQLNFRNHRKIVVVDGQIAIVGGFNLGVEYMGQATWTDHWRDTGVRLRGPIAIKVQAVFARDYYWAARHDLPEATWEPQPADACGKAIVCVTGPADELPRATMMITALAAAARHRLWIATPYLVPDEACVIALAMARARGVDVRLLLPSIPDAWSVFLAGFYYERELLKAGIHIFRYQPGAMHQKCILVDDALALVGSTNLDNRSLHLNFELMVAIEDAFLISSASAMFENDFSRSTASKLSTPPEHRWKYRAGRVVARLFSPVL